MSLVRSSVRAAEGQGHDLHPFDVFDQGNEAEVFDDVGVVGGLVVGDPVVFRLVLQVTASACSLP